ncbi:hypothetical protein [Haladaptatus halobius]|nr:hypothetical protein [Haladaptatus halobius]
MATISPIHGGTETYYPLSLDSATVIVAIGILVFGLIVFDAYRTYWG